MNSETCCQNPVRFTAYAIGIVGTLLTMAALVWLMRSYTQPAAMDSVRVEERLKAAAEVEQAAAQETKGYAWLDAGKGQVRLPIERAMEVAVQQWQDPASGHANLIARWDRFNPPVTPPKASDFE